MNVGELQIADSPVNDGSRSRTPVIATMDLYGDSGNDLTDTYDFDEAGNLQSVTGAGGT